MKSRPILFTAVMVRAILDGSKTQTRRIVSARNAEWNGPGMPRWVWPQLDFSDAWVDPGPSPAGNPGPYLKVDRRDGVEEYVDRIYCRWQPGDHLWVRETFCPVDDREFGGQEWTDYRATPKWGEDSPAGWDRDECGPGAAKWKPSIFMPRALSRIDLEVTGIRVERVQDISESDAAAEGLGSPITRDCKVPKFHDLWDSINEKRGFGWDQNPWCWVVEFERVESGGGS